MIVITAWSLEGGISEIVTPSDVAVEYKPALLWHLTVVYTVFCDMIYSSNEMKADLTSVVFVNG